ncbi:MAG: hypothetical protein L3J63_06285 [Geopsychrobacter sp.]|nr:hypothetical protein [Geopsychrobacter sp.]
MDIKEFCRNLDRLISSRDLRAEGLDTVIKALCQGLEVDVGEIALFLADEEAGALGFLWPRDLRNSGTIPFSAKDSLAARTYRDGKSLMDNHFSATRHASIFEAFPLKRLGGKAFPIQKIMSVPIRSPQACLGVLQICRKAANLEDVGADFTRTELLNTGLIGRTLARPL